MQSPAGYYTNTAWDINSTTTRARANGPQQRKPRINGRDNATASIIIPLSRPGMLPETSPDSSWAVAVRVRVRVAMGGFGGDGRWCCLWGLATMRNNVRYAIWPSPSHHVADPLNSSQSCRIPASKIRGLRAGKDDVMWAATRLVNSYFRSLRKMRRDRDHLSDSWILPLAFLLDRLG